MAGFVWFQGFNDQFSPAAIENYRNNMIAFIKDVRREYKVAKMPFVIGVVGFSVTKEAGEKDRIAIAQREAAAAPDFEGTVAGVESIPLYDREALKVFESGWAEHLYEWIVVGSQRPYHYLGSGKFFVRLGDAMATSMVTLLKK